MSSILSAAQTTIAASCSAIWPLAGDEYADIIGYHGYGFPDPVDPLFDSKLPREAIRYNVPNLTANVNAIVRRTGNSGKPVWMTEGGDGIPSSTSEDALTNDDRHAAFVARYLLQFMGRGTSLVAWYGWDFGAPFAFVRSPGIRANPMIALTKVAWHSARYTLGPPEKARAW